MTAWKFSEVLDCAAACPSLSKFVSRFPLVYAAARKKHWLPAVIIHCNWTRNGFGRTHTIPLPKPLYEILNDTGSLVEEAMADPMWPMETTNDYSGGYQ